MNAKATPDLPNSRALAGARSELGKLLVISEDCGALKRDPAGIYRRDAEARPKEL